MRTITLTIADDVSDADALAAVVKVVDLGRSTDSDAVFSPHTEFVGGITVEAIADAQGDAFLIQRGVK